MTAIIVELVLAASYFALDPCSTEVDEFGCCFRENPDASCNIYDSALTTGY